MQAYEQTEPKQSCHHVAAHSKYDEYIIVHVGKTAAGFAKRFFMFIDVLSKRRQTYVKKPVSGLWYLMMLCVRGKKACVVVYYDVLAPFVAVARLLFPSLNMVYMVRGDQVSWAKFHGRTLRAKVANILQGWMSRLGCMFVFASEDLYSAFVERLGPLRLAKVLPNTIGHSLPPSRPFDGRIGIVGDFNTVKNIEFVLNNLSMGQFHVDLFGNKSFPEKWKRPWLESHGVVIDLPSHLKYCSLIVLSSITEGFPNVAVEALEAGCCIVAPEEPPYEKLPLSPAWRYRMEPSDAHTNTDQRKDLVNVLNRIRAEQPDFRADNRELYDLIESSWENRIWEIFG